MERLSNELRAGLMEEAGRGSLAYVRNLAAAEQAVQRGQFNVAKVLRVAANAQRTIALNAARVLEKIDASVPTELLSVVLAEQEPLLGSSSLGELDQANHKEAVQTFFAQSRAVQTRVDDMLRRSLDSLANYPDVLERAVPIIVHSCRVCGNPVEVSRAPAECDICGAIASEFMFIGPFYAGTQEILGRLSPQQVLETLVATPAQVEALIGSVDDELLQRKPSPEEWCIKEIVGHMLETDYMCADAVKAVLAKRPYENEIAPWETHLGKGYEERSAQQLIELVHSARAETLATLQSLTLADWSSAYVSWGTDLSILDIGVWHANHDVGHLAQVRRLLAAWQGQSA